MARLLGAIRHIAEMKLFSAAMGATPKMRRIRARTVR